MRFRIAVFVVVLVLVGLGTAFFDVAIQPIVASQLAVEQIGDLDASSTTLRTYDAVQQAVPAIGTGAVLVSGCLLFGKQILSTVRSSMSAAVQLSNGRVSESNSNEEIL